MSKDPYQDDDGHFHEPSFGQMASMTTKSLIIAKLTGVAPGLTWKQILAPVFYAFLFSASIITLLCIMIAINSSGTHK